MNVAYALAEMLSKPAPPPPGWLNDLPEAFAATDEDGNVTVIGYQGEWYAPIKPKLRVRLHNWLIRVGERHGDAS